MIRTLFWVVAACAIAGISVASCRGGVITEEFLDRISWKESRNNPQAIGSLHELGAFQLRAVSVEHVNNTYGWRFDHKAAALDHGRAYARAYLLILEREMISALGRQPSQPEVYNGYRLGFSAWKRTHRAGMGKPTSRQLGARTISPSPNNGWSNGKRAKTRLGFGNADASGDSRGSRERPRVDLARSSNRKDTRIHDARDGGSNPPEAATFPTDPGSSVVGIPITTNPTTWAHGSSVVSATFGQSVGFPLSTQ